MAWSSQPPRKHAWHSVGALLQTVEVADDLGSASRRLSRALTIFDVLQRLDLERGGDGALRCHLLGADHREGRTIEESAAVFAPLCVLLRGRRWSEVRLLLCGPNCGLDGARKDVWHDAPRSADVPENEPRLKLCYSSAVYDECAAAHDTPHVAIAFNAGLWGYDSWASSVRAVLRSECPLVITSYNELEADDDQETLEDWANESAGDDGLGGVSDREMPSFIESAFTSRVEYDAWAKSQRDSGSGGRQCPWQWVWAPTINPWGSLIPEPRAVVLHSQYENHSTQCLRRR